MNDASGDIEWAADRKIGFAMGILLIGVVAALFFRNEQLPDDAVPSVQRRDLIDSRLRDRNVLVYEDDAADQNRDGQEPVWTMPELLEDYHARSPDLPLPVGAVPPEPSAASRSASDAPESLAEILGMPSSPTTDRPSASPVRSARPPDPASEPPQTAARKGPLRNETPPDRSPSTEFDEYTVRYGDTLSGIADRLLGSPARYRELYDANRDRIASPDRLQVGTTIRVPRL